MRLFSRPPRLQTLYQTHGSEKLLFQCANANMDAVSMGHEVRAPHQRPRWAGFAETCAPHEYIRDQRSERCSNLSFHFIVSCSDASPRRRPVMMCKRFFTILPAGTAGLWTKRKRLKSRTQDPCLLDNNRSRHSHCAMIRTMKRKHPGSVECG